MLRRYRGAGIDPLAEPILTYPVLHYQNGGLVIDTDAETTLEGVYACGEIAGGTHGRNRMMGNSPARVRRLRTARREGGSREGEKLMRHVDDRPCPGRRRGRGRPPLRVGAEGHPAGPARRARRGADAGDVASRASACSRRSTATSRSRTSRSNLVCQDTGIAVYYVPGRRALPAAPGADLRGAQGGDGARDGRAPAALERGAHDHAREHRRRTSGIGCRSSTGSSSPTGTGST